MRIFRDVNLVEQLGTGMNKIMSAYSANIFNITPNFLKVEFAYNNIKEEDKQNGENGVLNEGINEL